MAENHDHEHCRWAGLTRSPTPGWDKTETITLTRRSPC